MDQCREKFTDLLNRTIELTDGMEFTGVQMLQAVDIASPPGALPSFGMFRDADGSTVIVAFWRSFSGGPALIVQIPPSS